MNAYGGGGGDDMRLGFPGGLGGRPPVGAGFEFDRNCTDILLGGFESELFSVEMLGGALFWTSGA